MAYSAAAAAAYRDAMSSASNYNSGTGTNSSVAGASRSTPTGTNAYGTATTSASTPTVNTSAPKSENYNYLPQTTPNYSELLRQQLYAQTKNGTVPTNNLGTNTKYASGWDQMFKDIPYAQQLMSKDKLTEVERNQLAYLNREVTKESNPELYYALHPGEKKQDELAAQVAALISSLQSTQPELAQINTNYTPIAAITGNIPSITSGGGDNVLTTLSAYGLDDARQNALAEQAIQRFVANSQAQNSNNSNVISAMNMLDSLLNNQATQQYQQDYLGLQRDQNSFNNEMAIRSEAWNRVLAGVYSPADSALLGIDPTQYPYAQLNEMAKLDIARMNAQTAAMGLTV